MALTPIHSPALAGGEPERDGRRLRSQGSRARIVSAMLELIQGGEISPSAEQVAARAEVGLRTVFRHFTDMDSLYGEMSQAIEAEIRALYERPFPHGGPAETLSALVARRSGLFEKITPFRRAADTHRHRSRFLAAEGVRMVAALREILKRELPAEIAADEMRLEMLDLLLSYEAWIRLRRDQGLSVERAQEILEAAVMRLAGVQP